MMKHVQDVCCLVVKVRLSNVTGELKPVNHVPQLPHSDGINLCFTEKNKQTKKKPDRVLETIARFKILLHYK